MSIYSPDYEIPTTLAGRWNRFWFTPSSGRQLSLARCLVAVLALLWYLSFAPFISDWFGTGGLCTPQTVLEWRAANATEPTVQTFVRSQSWSIFALTQNTTVLWAMYACGAASLVAVICGWRVSTTTPIATFFVLSLMHRTVIFNGDGEAVLAMLLVYLSLAYNAPGRSLKQILIDRNAYDEEPEDFSVATTIATHLIQIHLTMFYISMIIGQLSQSVQFAQSCWQNGTAAWWLAARVDSRWVQLDWLREWEMLVNALTMGMVTFEFAMIFVWWDSPRKLLVAASVLIWGIFALMSGSVLLPLAMILAGVATLKPREFRSVNAKLA
jgi:hypothetical protein